MDMGSRSVIGSLRGFAASSRLRAGALGASSFRWCRFSFGIVGAAAGVWAGIRIAEV